MRPVAIRAEGFSAYRARVDVDLSDVDFFSLSGATGAGKSSLIDAMVFALYGRIPRLGGNSVAPAISAGSERARVAFDFEVRHDRYTAVRLIQRSARGGASVTEARLQRGEEVIADGADLMTVAVEDLLHLRFEDFIRTVVLPQGEFARFLTATKSERQSLLRQLLGLDVYSAVRTLARTRESIAEDRAGVAKAQHDALEIPEKVELKAARDQLDQLEQLEQSIVDEESALAVRQSDLEKAIAVRDRSLDRHERLERLAAPNNLEELDSLAIKARDSLEAAVSAEAEAESSTTTIEEQLLEIPAVELLQQINRNRDKNREVAGRLESLEASDAATDHATISSQIAGERAELEAIEARLEDLRVSHAAHSLSASLVVGDPCPVCEQEVERLPAKPRPEEFETLEESHQERSRRIRDLSDQLAAIQTELTRIEASRSELEKQSKELLEALNDAPLAEEIEELLHKRRILEGSLAESKKLGVQLAGEVSTARKELESLSESVRSIGRDLMAARQDVADLEPPLPESEDPVIQWKELLVWRTTALASANQQRTESFELVLELGKTVDKTRTEIEAKLADLGIAVEAPYAVQVTRALERARALVEDQASALAEAKKYTKAIEASAQEAKVAKALANHLKANGFERWLMSGAIADLVKGANGLLGELSDGGYSLRSDDEGSFTVIDHRNANEARSVSTLSGGETFLVSLALALSLAETLAAAGGAELDAIILDEGFGTLDEESLDTVASVLEELSGEGLMVGVITHVKELAARAPVRLEVTRGPGGASVKVMS